MILTRMYVHLARGSNENAVHGQTALDFDLAKASAKTRDAEV